MRRSRRQVLAGLCATALATGAGCQSDDSEQSGPPAERWIPSPDDGAVGYTALDWRRLVDAGGDRAYLDDPWEHGLGLDAFESDPMVYYPYDGLLASARGARIALADFDLLGLLRPYRDEADGSALQSTVDRTIRIGSVRVNTGDFDVDEVHERLVGDAGDANVVLERTDGYEGYDVYEPADADRSSFWLERAVAVDEDVLVSTIGEGAREDLRRVLETGVTGEDRAVDENEDLAWLVRTAGDGDAVFCAHDAPVTFGEDFPWPAVEESRGLVASLDFDAPDERNGRFAMLHDDPDEAALRDVLGSSADEATVEVDGERVTARATWSL